MAPSVPAGSPAFAATADANASMAPCASSVVPGEPGAQKTIVARGASARAAESASEAVSAAASRSVRAGLTLVPKVSRPRAPGGSQEVPRVECSRSDMDVRMRVAVPLSRRPLDVALVVFFAVNLVFTTYVVSLEQVVTADPLHFAPPPWPPERLLALVHWWERSFD